METKTILIVGGGVAAAAFGLYWWSQHHKAIATQAASSGGSGSGTGSTSSGASSSAPSSATPAPGLLAQASNVMMASAPVAHAAATPVRYAFIAPSSSPVSSGSAGYDPAVIQTVQQHFNTLGTPAALQNLSKFMGGIPSLAESGTLDAATVDAISRFQKAIGFDVTGEPDASTVAAIQTAVDAKNSNILFP
jgi:hypothetical protein